jgi:hypothetical protein
MGVSTLILKTAFLAILTTMIWVRGNPEAAVEFKDLKFIHFGNKS